MRTVAEVHGVTLPVYSGVSVGDIVELGASRGPRFSVIHIDGGEAWIRPISNGTAGLAPVSRLRRV